jgi:cell division protein FtsQ
MRRGVRFLLDHPRVLVVAALGFALLAGGYLALRDSPLVAVRKVTITGAGGPEGPRVRAALEEAARDMTTLHVRKAALFRAVQSYATVRDLRVERDLPHALRIDVIRRPAVAALNVNGERLPVAADGTLLRGSIAPRHVPTLAVTAPPGGARLTGDPRAQRALDMVTSAPQAMREHVARVDGRGVLRAQLRNGPEIILGDASRLRAKWIAAARVVGDPGARGARYVDVRLPERPVAGGLVQAEPSTTG